MRTTRKRLERERKTIEAMIALFCCDQHGSKGGLCSECAALAVYARQRLEKCPFQDDKPTCAKCPIHCYKPAARRQIQAVMRYAGPRMLLRRPLLAIGHLLHERKPTPKPPPRGTGKRPNRVGNAAR
jgi:hypothetical protein